MFKRSLVDRIGEIFVAIMLTATILLLLVPIASTLIMSFDAREYLGHFPPPAFSTKWYSRFWANDLLVTGLQTSVILALLSTAISVIVGIAASYVLVRYDFRGKEVLN